MSQIEIIPPDFASSALYDAGPDVGTATKVDPDTDANGFINGTVIAAQHVNYLMSAHADVSLRAVELAALKLRAVAQDGLTITDTVNSLAAVQRGEGTPLLAIKVDGAFFVSDWDRLHFQGALTLIDEVVTDAATDGTRILVAGFVTAVGYRVEYSDDDGTTWTAGASLGAAIANALFWNEAESRFIYLDETTGGTGRSTTGAAAWTTGGDSGVGSGSRLAILTNGDMLAVRTITGGGGLAFNVSTDAGATWNNTGGTIADAATSVGAGCLAGNNGALAYYVSRHSAGAELRINSTADGVTWTLLATLLPAGGATFDTNPTLRMCQNTGLLVVTCTSTSAHTLMFASLDGIRWVGPTQVFPVLRETGLAGATHTSDGVGLAGGKLIGTKDAELFASDGIGAA